MKFAFHRPTHHHLKLCVNKLADYLYIELCKNYDFDSVKKLLEKLGGDANLEETDEEGNTALLIAADCEDIEVVQLLIKAGCNVNHQNDD